MMVGNLAEIAAYRSGSIQKGTRTSVAYSSNVDKDSQRGGGVAKFPFPAFCCAVLYVRRFSNLNGYNRSEYKTKDCSKNTKFGIVSQDNLVNLLEDR
jgi:hypothetical protein